MRIAAVSRAVRLITVFRGAEAMDITAASVAGTEAEAARITAAAGAVNGASRGNAP